GVLGPAAEEAAQLGEDRALEGLVAGFAAAAGEDDFVGVSAEQVGYLLPAAFDGCVGCLAEGVSARRVAELLSEEGHHGINDCRIERRRGVVVEVDWAHVTPREIKNSSSL